MCHAYFQVNIFRLVKCDDMTPTSNNNDLLNYISVIIQSCELPYMNGHHKRAYLYDDASNTIDIGIDQY